jgi:hypothetical protein
MDRDIEHWRVVTEPPDKTWGKVVYFVLYVTCSEIGKHLDRNPMGGYQCPAYCDVDHKHIRRNDETAKEESDKEADDSIYRPVTIAGRE